MLIEHCISPALKYFQKVFDIFYTISYNKGENRDTLYTRETEFEFKCYKDGIDRGAGIIRMVI